MNVTETARAGRQDNLRNSVRAGLQGAGAEGAPLSRTDSGYKMPPSGPLSVRTRVEFALSLIHMPR